jgi:catalase
MFAYPDAARYRLGVNYQLLPTNHAVAPVYSPFQRDGYMNFSLNYGSDPNYVGSMLKPTLFKVTAASKSGAGSLTEHEKWAGQVSSFASEVTSEDYEQATQLWNVLGRDPGHQDRFVSNVADHLMGIANSKLKLMVYGE